jgi:hypothetical protein
MSPKSSSFDASPSMLGYLYQVRMALVLLLQKVKSDPGASVALENFDDISFHSGGNILEQLQTKLVSAKSLTDSSVDLWKTLRVWSEQFHQGSLDPASTTLTLLTTAEAPVGSAAAYLRVENRSLSKALEILEKITSQSKNVANQKGFEAFNRLSKIRKSQLLRSVYVLDKSPDMTKAEKLLRQELRVATAPKNIEAFASRVEGWWFGVAVQQLSGQRAFIKGSALLDELSDLREQFRLDALPIDFAEVALPKDWSFDDSKFVKQLQYINLSAARITSAKLDFYRATRQRGRWIDDQVISSEELTDFERRLVENWLDLFEDCRQECDGSNKPRTGREIYGRTLRTSHLLIRPGCTEPFVMRGSYHLLADIPKVGWHPEYESLLEQPSDEK